MKIRFQADNDLNQNIVRAVRRHNILIDFQTAHEAKLHNLSDEEVLAFAAGEERILVSHDRRTMPFYFAEFTSKQTSAGVILISQELPLNQAVAELLLIWEASETEEWVNSMLSIPL
jgi:hypothetical protein